MDIHMKAMGYAGFGPAQDVLELRGLEMPTPGADDVLVQLSLSGVNPSDVKARAGNRPGVTKPPFPFIIPHSDGAGTIVAVGQNVDPGRVGQRVWVWNGQWQRAFGTAATHICLHTDQAVPLPDGVSFETGASLGIPGLTAAHTMFAGGDVSGKTVLVQGAGGSVGFLAAQLGLWAGANVIATARGADMDRLRALGIQHVLDFTRPDIAPQIRDAAGGSVDHIVEVEFGLNAETDTAVISENGTIAAYGSALNMTPTLPFYPLMFKAVGLHMVLIYLLPPAPRLAAIQKLHQALADGALKCPVAEVIPLRDCAAAHELVESGARTGAVLVDCTG